MAKFTPDEFRAAMEKAPKRLFHEVSTRLVRRGREFIQRIFPRARLRGDPGLHNRTGRLRGSFNITSEGKDLNTWQMAEFTTSPYAKIHEHGGQIRPRSAKYLAVPLPAARTKGGDTRGGPRSFANTFFAKSKAGNLILFQNQGKGKKPLPLFVMKKQVTLKPRLGFFEEWTAHQKKRIEDIAKGIDVALDGLGA